MANTVRCCSFRAAVRTSVDRLDTGGRCQNTAHALHHGIITGFVARLASGLPCHAIHQPSLGASCMIPGTRRL